MILRSCLPGILRTYFLVCIYMYVIFELLCGNGVCSFALARVLCICVRLISNLSGGFCWHVFRGVSEYCADSHSGLELAAWSFFSVALSVYWRLGYNGYCLSCYRYQLRRCCGSCLTRV